MSALASVLSRDLARLFPGGRSSGALLPVLFFVSVAVLYPFAVGPNPAMLHATGGGVLWIAALLAAILPLDRLLADDLERGFFDQCAVRGISEDALVAVRLIAHWVSFGPPLMLATLPAGALLDLDARTLRMLELGLLAGTPGLAAIGLIISAVTAGLRGGAALAGLLLIPLAVPLLVFGAGALDRSGGAGGALALTAALSLVLCAIAPFAGGAAIRAARDG